MNDPQYMVIVGQIIGSPEAWSMQYHTDGKLFASRQAAISHGLGDLGHDDFNIGTVRDGMLVAFGWGHEDFAPEDADMAQVASQVGLVSAAARTDEGSGFGGAL